MMACCNRPPQNTSAVNVRWASSCDNSQIKVRVLGSRVSSNRPSIRTISCKYSSKPCYTKRNVICMGKYQKIVFWHLPIVQSNSSCLSCSNGRTFSFDNSDITIKKPPIGRYKVQKNTTSLKDGCSCTDLCVAIHVWNIITRRFLLSIPLKLMPHVVSAQV